MLKSMKRLCQDRRGNVLAVVGAAIPLVVGAAGLATDTIQWVTWKRELQRAADSAAFAGVYAKAQDPTLAVDAAVSADIVKHNNTNIVLSSGYPLITYPSATGWNSAVRVTLRVQKRLGFSSLFISSPPNITATATAAMIPDGKYCVVALEDGATAGISVGGSADVNLGCGVISNSINVDEAIDVTGNAYHLDAEPVAGSGGLPTASLEAHGASDIQPYHMPQQDPYKNPNGTDKYPTDIPTPLQSQCTSFGDSAKTNANGTKKPGCYTSFGPGTLSPGVYYLKDTGISLNGNDLLAGEGVTIILTGSTPGTIQINGNSRVQLTAPTATTCGSFGSPAVDSCNYRDMLLIQAANASLANDNKILGNNGSFLDGAMYFPNGLLTFTGSSTAMTQCAMIVSRRVNFTGNNEIQNDMDADDCDADTSVPNYVVRLVG